MLRDHVLEIVYALNSIWFH